MYLRASALAACAALGFSLFATGNGHAAPKAETVRPLVQRLLLVAPTNFASGRGAIKDREDYYSRYAVVSRLGACSRCNLTNQYSWSGHSENWYIENEWYAKGWTQAKLISYIRAQLAPALRSYAFTTDGDKDYPTFTWRGKTNTWVFIHVFSGGFTLRVGHDLAKPMHVLLPPIAPELAALRAGASSFVSSGVGAASNNFESLRAAGKRNAVDDMEYNLYVPFGAMLQKCSVTDASANTLKLDDYSPKWTMNCQTPPMVGTKAALEPQILAAVQAALPSGFTATTDKTLLYFDDYRWDNTSTEVAVDIDSIASVELPDGLVQFNLGVIHFLPKQSTPSAAGKPRRR